MELERGQRTLFDCSKVVSGGKGGSWVVFSESNIISFRETLLRPDSSMHLLLNVLRKLDCYSLQLSDMSRTDIGRAVATVAACHPRPEVAKLASTLLQKWQAQFDAALFTRLDYDCEVAAAAPEGDAAEFKLHAPPPPPPPPPTRIQPPRKDRATRIKEEDAFLDDSEFEGISESDSESEVDEWQPAGGRRKSGASGAGSAKKQKS